MEKRFNTRWVRTPVLAHHGEEVQHQVGPDLLTIEEKFNTRWVQSLLTMEKRFNTRWVRNCSL
jgi:hypothetical protein